MKTASSIGRIVWSLAYVFLALVIVRLAMSSPPLRVGAPSQQSQRKSLEQAFSSNPQIRITKLKIGSHTREFDEEFDESDDWPKRLTLEVENISTKPIVYLQLNLNFPETKASGNIMSYPVVVGTDPNSTRATSSNKLWRLAPGEKFEITLNDDYDKLERFIRIRHRMNEIRRAQVEVGFMVFEDKTAWTAGDFLVPDPNNPKHYVNVGRKVPS